MGLKNIIQYLIAICLLWPVVSCKSVRTSTTTETKVIDSTYTVEKLRMVPVDIPSREIKYSLQVECDSSTNLPKPILFDKSDNDVSVKFTIDSTGYLVGNCECDSIKHQVEVKDRVITRLRKEIEKTKELQVVQKTKWYDKLLRGVAGLLIILLVLKFLPFKSK